MVLRDSRSEWSSMGRDGDGRSQQTWNDAPVTSLPYPLHKLGLHLLLCVKLMLLCFFYSAGECPQEQDSTLLDPQGCRVLSLADSGESSPCVMSSWHVTSLGSGGRVEVQRGTLFLMQSHTFGNLCQKLCVCCLRLQNIWTPFHIFFWGFPMKSFVRKTACRILISRLSNCPTWVRPAMAHKLI